MLWWPFFLPHADHAPSMIYRSPCNPVFGWANITIPSRYATRTVSTAFTAEDHILTGLINLFSELPNCLNYFLFLGCLRGCSAAYSPCPGSAWCGANSRHELKRAVMTACRYNRVDSRVVNLNGISVTLSIALIQLLTDPFLYFTVYVCWEFFHWALTMTLMIMSS